LHQVTLTVSDMDQVRPAGMVVEDLLRRYHVKNDFAITIPLDRLEEAERTKDRYTALLAVVGGISLMVGGIGIINIMLATVTGGTRELGDRRALGAKRRDITLQFRIEAVVQTTVGGLVGVILGLTVIYVVPWLASAIWQANVPAKLHVPAIFIAVGASVAV